MSVGQMYAAILYGKNMMGAYASQLDTRQRWQVIAYMKKVQSENGGDAFTFGTTTAAKDAPVVDTSKKTETKATDKMAAAKK
jgi:hypothetical protein